MLGILLLQLDHSPVSETCPNLTFSLSRLTVPVGVDATYHCSHATPSTAQHHSIKVHFFFTWLIRLGVGTRFYYHISYVGSFDEDFDEIWGKVLTTRSLIFAKIERSGRSWDSHSATVDVNLS